MKRDDAKWLEGKLAALEELEQMATDYEKIIQPGTPIERTVPQPDIDQARKCIMDSAKLRGILDVPRETPPDHAGAVAMTAAPSRQWAELTAQEQLALLEPRMAAVRARLEAERDAGATVVAATLPEAAGGAVGGGDGVADGKAGKGGGDALAKGK